MGWSEVDAESATIGSVSAPTGEIGMPDRQDGVVGETKTFNFSGKNTNPVKKWLRLAIWIHNPTGTLIAEETRDAEVVSGGWNTKAIPITYTIAGDYVATVKLYVGY